MENYQFPTALKMMLLALGICAWQSMVTISCFGAPPKTNTKPQTVPMMQSSAGITVRCAVKSLSAWCNLMPGIMLDEPVPVENRSYRFITITTLSFTNTSDKPVTVSVQSVQIDADKKQYKPEHVAFQRLDGKNTTQLSLSPKQQTSMELRAEGNNIPNVGENKPIAVTITLLAGSEKLTLGSRTKLEHAY